MMIPKNWREVTLKQYSAYNELIADYQEQIKDLDPENNKDATMILLKEVNFQYEVCILFSKESKESIYLKDVGFIKDYSSKLEFLQEKPTEHKLVRFTFKGVEYKMPEDMRINTKYGQYVEAVQSEMAWNALNKNSLMYLAHQLAHQVEFSEEWSQDERDKLAIVFEDVSMGVFFDFGFFLESQSAIYTAVYLNLSSQELLKNLPFTKRLLVGWGVLKRYMNWQKVVYLKDLAVLRLIVFYIQTRERFSNI